MNFSIALPGISVHNQKLQDEFRKIWRQLGTTYKPRTKHLDDVGDAKYTNRLFLESSPYLLQHAHNPVNWYPWGDEAFDAAKKLQLPVLLSIGYSTCHWCHVMEEESFEDEEIARYINENYVAVKVDREERPDVDAIYMSAVQAMTGSGGWPMNTWLTHDRKPFYGGTYFPAREGDRGAGVGFLTILQKLKEIFQLDPEKVQQQSLQLASHIETALSPSAAGTKLPTSANIDTAVRAYQSYFDDVHGGMAGAPKFPSSLSSSLLFRYFAKNPSDAILDMANLSLSKMADGGIYDHVAGGFHRYSTDNRWFVPHFEKMLYDNALLAVSYLEGYQVTGNNDFRRVAEEILAYVKRDMTSSEGAFYSATDADSLNPDGRRDEGYFFTWTPKELDEILGELYSKIVKVYYNVVDTGNFEGRNILHVTRTKKQIAQQFAITIEELEGVLSQSREKLYQHRKRRDLPIRDEKILTSWNGLMISAFAQAGATLNRQDYTDTAVKAAQFIQNNLYKDGRLLRTNKEGFCENNRAFLDDYAFYTASLIDLYEATHDLQWFELAVQLDKVLAQKYEDLDHGAFFRTGDDHEQLLVREKPAYDGAEPSGNSCAVLNLLRLYEYTADASYLQRAEKSFKALQMIFDKRPLALSEMMLAVDFYLDKPKEIVLVYAEGKEASVKPFLREYRKHYLPNKTLVVISEQSIARAARRMPLLVGKQVLPRHQQEGGDLTAYVCEQGVCKAPTGDVAVFGRQLASSSSK